MKNYYWVVPLIEKRVAAEAAGAVFEEIEHKYGALTPELVLKHARSRKSPIHPAFEWDDGVAAELYRRTQASWMIRNLRVRVVQDETEPVEVRAYLSVSDTETEKPVYVNVETTLGTPEWRNEVYADVKRDVGNLYRKMRGLEQYEKAFGLVADQLYTTLKLLDEVPAMA